MDSIISEDHMEKTTHFLTSTLNTWLFTTCAIFFGVLLPIRYFASKKRAQPMASSDNPVTLVVNEKEGVRQLNPYYVPSSERPADRNPVVLYDSICDAVQDHLKHNPDAPVFGSHATPADPYEWISYRQFADMFIEFGSGLKAKFGIEPESGEKMGIYAINCTEWVVAHFGMLFYSNIAVPLYSTLGENAMVHIVKLTQMSLCVCFNEERTESLLDALLKASKSGDSEAISSLKSIVIMQPKSQERMNKLREKYASCLPQVRFFTMEEVREAGRGNLLPFKCPGPDGIYVINFTSGTTGIPKGVIITCTMFKHVICSVLGSGNILDVSNTPKRRWMDNTDTYFSFLPLAHVLEQTLMAACIFCRARVGFFSGEITKLMDDIATLRPTMLALVPRLLIRIFDATLAKLSAKHIPRWVLNYAVNAKLAHVRRLGRPINDTIWDRLVFRSLQEKLGGRLRLLITGSAACPKDVLDFTRAAYGATLHVGYGSTETGGVVTLSFSDDTDAHHVGVPLEGIQVKLGDVPDMGLFPMSCKGRPRGEVLVKGPTCTPGYYKDEERTRELKDDQGWLHTGDVGEWDELGRLCIVDRCKNLFKLSQGEYIAPDRVEGIYQTSSLVVQVFLDGKSDSSFAIAIVHPNGERLAEKLGFKLKQTPSTPAPTSNGKPEITMEELCMKQEAVNMVLCELTSIGKANGLSGFEQAKKLILVPEQFSIESGLITATLKPVRAKIREHYAKEIQLMYSQGI